MTTENNTASLFPKGDKLSADWFSGNAFLQPIFWLAPVSDDDYQKANSN